MELQKMDRARLPSAKAVPLALASLHLLVSPVQLLSASMWQIIQKKEVMSYWEVSEFVLFVMETVPELLLFKHWIQLTLGLRTQFILELCKKGEDQELIRSHLEKIKTPWSTQLKEVTAEEKAVDDFTELILVLLKNSQERRTFFEDLWSKESRAVFDSDLQMLVWEFLCRLHQLLPVPELDQIVLWLGESCVFEDFIQCLSEPTHMKNLLHHHKQLEHFEQHVPHSSMGDHILPWLSTASLKKATRQEEKSNFESESNQFHAPNQTLHPVSFIEDIAMEVVTVTEYAEVELPANSDIEVVVEDTNQNNIMGEEAITNVLSDNVTKSTEESEAVEKKNEVVILEDSNILQPKIVSGPHNCPDCDKKFKFASFLVAHRVIHTGERPHKCTQCGRCFSFRQSLERHRHTHKIGKSYECPICCEKLSSVAARNAHMLIHMQDGAYNCQQCDKKFSQELALEQHLKTHMDYNANSEIVESEQEIVTAKKDIEEMASEPTGGQNKCKDVDSSTSGNAVINAQLMNEVISLVKVRTSGRKRKPTMKVQMSESQKRNKMVKGGEKDGGMKTAQLLKSSEHSYGATTATSKEHKGAVTGDALFSCPQSDYSHSDQVQQHINSSHFNQPNSEKTTQEAMAENTEGQYNCSHCPKTFKFLSLLKSHQRIHTGEQPYICTHCDRRFTFKQSLERHRLLHTTDCNFKCTICGELFKSLVDYKEHTSTHMQNGEYFCTKCCKKFSWKSAFVRHLRMFCSKVGNNRFKCPHCELDFDSNSTLNSHIQLHHESRLHVCFCGKSFAHKAALTSHKRIHQKDRPHVCIHCGKGFLYRGGLLTHLKIHSQEMAFSCSFCNKGFKRERNMKKHERCHTREDVFQCPQCDKSFVYKATLIRHELTHSGERPYLCSDCGKGFFSHAELLKHERFHTGHKPFECQHCGKKFTQSCYLTIHLRYHTGAKPYSCSDCDKSFLSANRLKRHQRTHSGERPYLCGECGKGFRQSYHLKMHQRTHAISM